MRILHAPGDTAERFSSLAIAPGTRAPKRAMMLRGVLVNAASNIGHAGPHNHPSSFVSRPACTGHAICSSHVCGRQSITRQAQVFRKFSCLKMVRTLGRYSSGFKLYTPLYSLYVMPAIHPPCHHQETLNEGPVLAAKICHTTSQAASHRTVSRLLNLVRELLLTSHLLTVLSNLHSVPLPSLLSSPFVHLDKPGKNAARSASREYIANCALSALPSSL